MSFMALKLRQGKCALLFASAVAAIASLNARALGRATDSAEFVPAPVEKVFSPGGYVASENAEIVAFGHFPNSCYKAGPATATVDEAAKTIVIVAQAYYVRNLECAQLLVPFMVPIELGTIKAGEYQILVQGLPNVETNDLVVNPAGTDTEDKLLYAPVDQGALTRNQDGSISLTLEGTYPLTFVGCMVITEVRAERTPGNNVVVLPIAKLTTDETQCKTQRESRRFFIQKTLAFPLEDGDYLLHARALSGRSLNRIATL